MIQGSLPAISRARLPRVGRGVSDRHLVHRSSLHGRVRAVHLARAVIGDLVTSTLLTLLVVPVVTSYLDGVATRGKRRLSSSAGGSLFFARAAGG